MVETSATEERLMTQEDFTRFSLDRGLAMADIREIWNAMFQDSMLLERCFDENTDEAGMTDVGDTQGSAGPALQPLAPLAALAVLQPRAPAAPTDDTEGFDGEFEDSWGGGDAMGGRFHGSAELDPMQDGPGYEENALGGIATPLEEDVPLECEFETEPAPTFDRADYDPVIQVDDNASSDDLPAMRENDLSSDDLPVMHENDLSSDELPASPLDDESDTFQTPEKKRKHDPETEFDWADYTP